MLNANTLKSVAKSVQTIRLGISKNDLTKCQAAYRYVRQYLSDLPEAPSQVSTFELVVKVVDSRLLTERSRIDRERRILFG